MSSSIKGTMEKSVSVITNTLFEKLPHNVSFYTQDSLVQNGLPSFLVKRVAHLVYQRIIEKIILPDQDWLDRDSDRVAEAWLELTGAIKEEVRVPADLMKEFLTEAVRDCLELTVYPRKTILKYLFAENKELDISAITERSASITVNRYLVWSLIRYMEKKEKAVIDRTHAESILSKIDEKVVENYHPLNWLALVKPLYELCGPNVPSGLLRLFFEDKKQQPASREFDLMDREISETEFIEVLSSPGLLYVEGYKDDQQSLFQDSSEDALEDPLNQKFMNKTDDLPEILPVDDEADIPEPIVTEDDVESALDTEQTAPWNEDESEPEEGSEAALADLYRDQEQYQEDEEEDHLGRAVLDEVDDDYDEEDRLEKVDLDEDEDSDEDHVAAAVADQEEQLETADVDKEDDHLEKNVVDQDGSSEEQLTLADSEISDSETFPEEETESEIVEPVKGRSEVSIKAIEIDDEDDEYEPESDSEANHDDERELEPEPWSDPEPEITEDESESDNLSDFYLKNNLLSDEPSELEAAEDEHTESDPNSIIEIFESEQTDEISEEEDDDDQTELRSLRETDWSEDENEEPEGEAFGAEFIEKEPELDVEDVESKIDEPDSAVESEPEPDSEPEDEDSSEDESRVEIGTKPIMSGVEEPEDEESEADEKAGEETLASRFIFDDEGDSEKEIEPDLDEATTIYDELNLARKGAEPSTLDLFSIPESDSFEVSQHSEPDAHLSDLNDEEEETASEEHETDTEPPLFVDESEFEELEEEGGDDPDLPMWRSFLEREDVDSPSSFQFDDSRYDVKGENPDEIEDDENDKTLGETAIDEYAEEEEFPDETAIDEDAELLDEDGFIEEPIYDLTKEDEPIEQKIGGLNEWLLDEKDRFIEEIFGDSEDAYEQALADIIACDDWKSASRYIEKEIFTRNRIDVYDEISVDFTDRLHSYFLENK